MFLLALIVIAAVALRASTAAERARLIEAAKVALRQATDAVERGRKKAEADPFRDALRARMPRALVTQSLAGLNAAIFLLMILGAGAFSDPETLIGWGGNFGPRTTNGEWWRLVMSMFVHSGMFHLLVNLAALVQVGLVLERLVGHAAFGAVYIAAGVLAALVSLAVQPVAVSVGSSGAIYGLYGVLLASVTASMLRRSTVTIPLPVVKRLGPAAGMFFLFNLVSGALPAAAEIAGLATGMTCGFVLVIGVGDQKPPVRRLATAVGATAMIVLGAAISVRGVADVRPELERVVAIEGRIATTYDAAVVKFRKQEIDVDALTDLIDRTITPELNAARERLNVLKGVPAEYQGLVEAADEYLRLRNQSWRLRAEGLRTTNTAKLREAEKAERASLRALETITPVNQ
jgi:rhomboid protease GluP